MTAVHLLLLAVLISVLAPRLLPTAGWIYRAPGLGLIAWYAVLASTVLAITAAALSLLVAPAVRQTVCGWWLLCLDALAGRLGLIGHAAGWLVVAGLGVVAGRAVPVAVRAARHGLRLRSEHLAALAILGRPDPALGAVVIDDHRPAAYALPGRNGRIVITTGALATLPIGQVEAVLAHERAHSTGHHLILLSTVRVLTAAFPGVTLLKDAHRQIDRLVELRADEVATRTHDPYELARALVACAEAAQRLARLPVPATAASAHGGDVLERVNRLLDPPSALRRGYRLAITAALAGLVSAPAIVAGLGLAVPALGGCLQ
jgi:Zn-dependent protease with chaperone function